MKKLLALFLAGCMTFGLVACTPKADDTTANSTTANSTTSQAENTADTKEPVKLVYWSTWNEAEPQGGVIKEAAAKYMEENKNVTVEINWQGRDIIKVIGTKLSAGEPIDLFDGSVNVILPATLDYASDLTQYYAKNYPTTNGKPYGEVVLKAMQDVVKTYSNKGQINGIAYQPFIQAIFYNKDHFAKAGITAIPKTWDEFLAACEKLKAAGFAPLTSDDAYMMSLPGYYLQRAKGAEWVSKLVKENKDEMWKDPAVLEMAKAYSNMAKNGYFHKNMTSSVFPAAQQDLANGQVSMYLNGSWVINELMPVTGPDFPWGAMMFPSVPNGTGKYNAACYGCQSIVVNKNSKNIEEAFKFGVYLTTGEWDAKLAEKTFGVPVGGESKWPVQLADAEAMFKSLEECTPWSGGIEDNGDLTAPLRTLFTKLIGGQITPEQFVKGAVDLK